ncbi:unnamed protein product [Kuraishia capsulata CBS 1993]|uniref:Uncharacterized protein n=1 Tax=Kuraishia capsulata CBS 1993 TaxID=1382522 RepID=W6MNJ7_9ASCO|nr:uncharacterized protein KUCA_T00002590001 [Kuraishia capsulata CBS 1993]CDK26617.1 unnamed protein product [Kuraishia capsulata CBS 1993]
MTDEVQFVSTQIQSRAEEFNHQLAVSEDLRQFSHVSLIDNPANSAKTRTKSTHRVKQRRPKSISSHVRTKFSARHKKSLFEMRSDRFKIVDSKASRGILYDSESWTHRYVKLIPPCVPKPKIRAFDQKGEADLNESIWGKAGTSPDLKDQDLETLYDSTTERRVKKNAKLQQQSDVYAYDDESSMNQSFPQSLEANNIEADDKLEIENSSADEGEELLLEVWPNKKQKAIEARYRAAEMEIENSSGEENVLCELWLQEHLDTTASSHWNFKESEEIANSSEEEELLTMQ